MVLPGELWTLSWDATTLGHAMISAVKQDYVLAWPVTMPGEVSFRPGILIDSPLGYPVTAWPTRETGIGNHLLGEAVGDLLSVETVRSISSSLDSDEEPSEVIWVEGWGTEFEEAQFASRWTDICLHTGREDDSQRFLSEPRLRAIGGKAATVQAVLQLDPEQTRSAWLGETPLDPDQVASLARALDAEPEDFLGPDPAIGLWLELAKPTFKRDVLETAASAALPEAEVRLVASRDAYALAARDDSTARTHQKLRDALRRIARGASH